MNIYFINGCEPEGNAVARANWENEQLTAEETSCFETMFPEMQKITGQIEFIITSAKVRACHSAYVLATFFKCRMYMTANKYLDNMGKEEAVIKAINKLIGKENVVVVGYNPYIGRLINVMTHPDSGRNEVVLKKNELALVKYHGFIVPHQGQLEWIKNLLEAVR